ncbi:MAG TPA: hypothetical protein VMT54_09535 [Candidatus Cybelea sp.]|nr:hypothetical protein [Candidatus Cybelea sp.]
MSLIMQMHFLGADEAAVKALAKRATTESGVRLAIRGDSTIELTAAHDALANNADWNAPYWSMNPDALPQLESEVRTLHKLSASDTLLSALWAGESATERISLSLDDMAAIIRAGKIGTRSQYRISRRAGSGGSQP